MCKTTRVYPPPKWPILCLLIHSPLPCHVNGVSTKYAVCVCACVRACVFVCVRVCVCVCEVLWWDTRKLQDPIDTFCVDVQKKQDCARTTGATFLEYEPTMVRCVCSRHQLITMNLHI